MNAPTVLTPCVLDHQSLKEGDIDPELNKKIEVLVLCHELFIIYLADDYSIQWRTVDAHQEPKHCGEILNRVASLEMRSRFITDTEILRGIRYQIAEGLARCLEGRPATLSHAILKEVELEVQARNRETSWGWYFTAAYPVTALSIAGMIMLWLSRSWVRDAIGNIAFDVVFGALCGAVGALLSVTARGDRLIMDANAGKAIHNLEGLSRIGTGIGGAFVVALAVKSGIILGGTHFSGNPFALLLALCVVAGASERLVPSLVKNIEKVALHAGDREQTIGSQQTRDVQSGTQPSD